MAVIKIIYYIILLQLFMILYLNIYENLNYLHKLWFLSSVMQNNISIKWNNSSSFYIIFIRSSDTLQINLGSAARSILRNLQILLKRLADRHSSSIDLMQRNLEKFRLVCVFFVNWLQFKNIELVISVNQHNYLGVCKNLSES